MVYRDFSTEWEETTDFLGTPHVSLVWQVLDATENFESVSESPTSQILAGITKPRHSPNPIRR